MGPVAWVMYSAAQNHPILIVYLSHQGLLNHARHMRLALRLTASVGGVRVSSRFHLDLTVRLQVFRRSTPPLRKTCILSRLILRIKYQAIHSQRNPLHAPRT